MLQLEIHFSKITSKFTVKKNILISSRRPCYSGPQERTTLERNISSILWEKNGDLRQMDNERGNTSKGFKRDSQRWTAAWALSARRPSCPIPCCICWMSPRFRRCISLITFWCSCRARSRPCIRPCICPSCWYPWCLSRSLGTQDRIRPGVYLPPVYRLVSSLPDQETLRLFC